MNIEIFGVVIARLHPDYIIFYLAIIIYGILAVDAWRRQRVIQKDVNLLKGWVFGKLLDYIDSMEEAKDP